MSNLDDDRLGGSGDSHLLDLGLLDLGLLDDGRLDDGCLDRCSVRYDWLDDRGDLCRSVRRNLGDLLLDDNGGDLSDDLGDHCRRGGVDNGCRGVDHLDVCWRGCAVRVLGQSAASKTRSPASSQSGCAPSEVKLGLAGNSTVCEVVDVFENLAQFRDLQLASVGGLSTSRKITHGEPVGAHLKRLHRLEVLIALRHLLRTKQSWSERWVFV
jgi:hypothetical protein